MDFSGLRRVSVLAFDGSRVNTGHMKFPAVLAFSLLALSSAHGAAPSKAEVGPPAPAKGEAVTQEVGKTEVDGPAKKAFAEFSAGHHDAAVELAKPLAEKGVAEAIYLLGFAHETGNGATASPDKAMEYYRKGMEKGHADSVFRLAFMLIATQDEKQLKEAQTILEKQALSDPAVSGRILGEAYLLGSFTGKPDAEKAVEWWDKAIKAGDVSSMLFNARFYDGQLGFPEKSDPSLAMKYFQMASDAGNPAAMVAVGSRLLFGKTASKDEARAIKLLNKAIESKEYTAHLALGTYQETIKKDSKAALAEYERGKDAGNLESMVIAAGYYIEGKGTAKDVPRGLQILQKAAEAGSAQAHLMLAANSLQGEKPDISSGYVHLVAAANAGLATAQNDLGLFYLTGKLGAADVSAAVSWFGRSAQSNFAAAQNNLAALHERGTGVAQDYGKAAQLYALAAQQGHAAATLALARFHAAGAATEVDKPRAWALGKIAAERGEANAAAFLEILEKEFSEKELAAAKKILEGMTNTKPAK